MPEPTELKFPWKALAEGGEQGGGIRICHLFNDKPLPGIASPKHEPTVVTLTTLRHQRPAEVALFILEQYLF